MLVQCVGNVSGAVFPNLAGKFDLSHPSMYGIFTYIWLILMVNVGMNIPYMDGMCMGQTSLYPLPKSLLLIGNG